MTGFGCKCGGLLLKGGECEDCGRLNEIERMQVEAIAIRDKVGERTASLHELARLAAIYYKRNTKLNEADRLAYEKRVHAHIVRGVPLRQLFADESVLERLHDFAVAFDPRGERHPDLKSIADVRHRLRVGM